MANSKTTKDLIKGALNHAGELPDGNSDFHQLALKYINKIYKDVLSASSLFNIDIGEPFNWAVARQPISLILEPAYDVGTVALTNGVDSGVFSSPPAVSHKDRYLLLTNSGAPTYYKIVAHTGGSPNFTLDSVFIEETVAAASFKSIKLIYDLGNGLLRLLEPFRVYSTDSVFMADDHGKIYAMDTKRFRYDSPLKWLVQGIPELYTTIYRDDVEWLIQFDAYPSKQVKIDVDYIPFPDDLIDTEDSIPVIPIEYRDILEFGTAFFILQDKHDDKADRFSQITSTALKKMVEGERRQIAHGTKNRGSLIPRMDLYNRRNRYFLK